MTDNLLFLHSPFLLVYPYLQTQVLPLLLLVLHRSLSPQLLSALHSRTLSMNEINVVMSVVMAAQEVEEGSTGNFIKGDQSKS